MKQEIHNKYGQPLKHKTIPAVLFSGAGTYKKPWCKICGERMSNGHECNRKN